MLRRRQLSEGAPFAERRIPAVGADDEVGREIARPVRTVGPYSNDAVPRSNQVPDRRPHVEVEGRVLAGPLGEHGEDCRLRDEATDEAQRLGRDPGPSPPPLIEVDRVDDGPGELPEPSPSPIWSKASMPLGCSPSPRKVRRSQGDAPAARPPPRGGPAGRRGPPRPAPLRR